MYLEMYDSAMSSMISQMLTRSSTTGLWFIGELNAPSNTVKTAAGVHIKYKMDHLACFAPGMLALGAFHAYVTVLALVSVLKRESVCACACVCAQ